MQASAQFEHRWCKANIRNLREDVKFSKKIHFGETSLHGEFITGRAPVAQHLSLAPSIARDLAVRDIVMVSALAVDPVSCYFT